MSSLGTATNFPQFIDTGHCICGLVNSAEAARNGETTQSWRCIGDLTKNLLVDTNGKWFNTSLPSQELSGINRPQNSGENPPDLSQAYVVIETNGKGMYQKLSGDAPQLIGQDKSCTGKNDTMASEQFYHDPKSAVSKSAASSSTMASSMSSSMSSMSSMSSISGMMSSAMSSATSMPASSQSASMTASSSPSSTSSASSSSSTSASTPQMPHTNLKAALVVGMLFASTFAMAL